MARTHGFFGDAEPRKVVAWSFFDFGNSAYALIMLSFAFPVYFKEALAPPGRGDFLWGLLVGGSALLGALSAPWIGAWTEARGLRRAALAGFTVSAALGALALGLLPFEAMDPSSAGRNLPASSALSAFPAFSNLWAAWALPAALFLFVMANVSFELALVLYDSFLPQVSTPSTSGRVSGLGWGLGYAGAILALVALRPWYADGPTGTGAASYRMTFALAAGMFILAALPALLTLRDHAVPRRGAPPLPGDPRQGSREGTRSRLLSALEAFRRDRRIPMLMAATFLLNDALVTLFVFVPVYAKDTLGMPMGEIAVLLIAVQLVGLPSSILSGRLADRVGFKPVLLASLAVWCLVVILAAAARSPAAFYPAAALTGLVIGSSQSVYRSWFAALAPPGRTAEYFGFNALAGRSAAVFGPLAFGAVSSWLGPRFAMASLLVPFLLSAFLFSRVRETLRGS